MASDSTPRSKVVLTEHLDDDVADWLAQRVELIRCSHEDLKFPELLPQIEGLVVRTYTIVDDRLLDAAPRLKVIGRAGVGLDNIDLEACRRRGVRVVSTPDANTQAVVEYVWALVLDVVRPRQSMTGFVPAAQFHQMRKINVGRQLDEITLGILGMGRIGRRIAQVARAIGTRVVWNDVLTPQELGLDPAQSGEFVDKAKLWREADVLTIHVDGRRENRNLLDAAVLAQLKPGCLLINTSRGFVVDPAALADWARSAAVETQGGRAVLDVHEPEPPPPEYPLWNLPNVRLLPHLASRTHRAMSNMSWVVRDVLKVLQGDEPQWPAV